MFFTLSNVPLRSISFGLEDRRLLWSRVRVYADRIVMTAWSLAGRHHRELPLSRIEDIAADDGRVYIDLETGERVVLILDDAQRWASFVRDQRNLREHSQSG